MAVGAMPLCFLAEVEAVVVRSIRVIPAESSCLIVASSANAGMAKAASSAAAITVLLIDLLLMIRSRPVAEEKCATF
jgi:hypothetical protein